MSSCTTVVKFFPKDEMDSLVKAVVDVLVSIPADSLKKVDFLRWLHQGSDPSIVLEEIVTALAKSKKTTDQDKIGARIQHLISGTTCSDFNVKAHIQMVNDQQDAAFLALTPEQLKAYNDMSEKEFLEFSFP